MLSVFILTMGYGLPAQSHQFHQPIVYTSLGLIKGNDTLQTVLGKTIYSFRGIRYAKAPIGDLRFRPPQPVDSWEGIYDASQDGAACPQPYRNDTDEDCLFLNVYTTQMPTEHRNLNLPVLVFIHGGSYSWLSARSDLFGPDYLLDQDMVLVTLNYRLASLGFISTGDEFAPGNNGLKDQVAALKWVKHNIAHFGGNPNSVTLSGQSAGAVSVSLHLVSPMSRGLFHKAVMMSGSIMGNYPVPNHQFDLAQKQARFVNCPDRNSEEIIACLRTKSAAEISNTLDGFDEFLKDPLYKWLPVIEPDCGTERFLMNNPVRSILREDFQRVPVILGITTNETENFASRLLSDNSKWLKLMDINFEKVAPISFMYERNTENSRHISKELRKFYLGNESLTEDDLPQIGKLYADGQIGFSVNRAARLLAAMNSEFTYYYRFNFQSRHHLNDMYADKFKAKYCFPENLDKQSLFHGDDLLYMFYVSTYFPRFKATDSEYRTVQRLTTMIRNFMWTGNPTPAVSGLFDGIVWKPIRSKDNVYLDIGQTLSMESNLYEDRYSVWDKLFPLFNNTNH